MQGKVKSPIALNREVAEQSDERGVKIALSEVEDAFCKHYKLCFTEMEELDVTRFKSVIDWGVAIIRVFDKAKPENSVKAWNEVVLDKTQVERRKLLINLVSRLETEKQELSSPLKRGPETGSVALNHDIMRSLLVAYDENQELGISVNLSLIAKEHGVKRQTIHVKWKRLVANPKVYRNVINNK